MRLSQVQQQEDASEVEQPGVEPASINWLIWKANNTSGIFICSATMPVSATPLEMKLSHYADANFS